MAEAFTLRDAPGSSMFMAGGLDLIDWLKFGNAIDRLIRLDRIPGLSAIIARPDQLRIGAMATHAAITDNTLVRDLLPDLATIWSGVANPRVRFVGTIGGNVMARHAEYDALPALLALGAEAEFVNPAGLERVALHQLPLHHHPLLDGFVISKPRTLRLFADRSLRPAVTVWLGLTLANEQVLALRVAVGMAHPSPVCITLPLDVTQGDLKREAPSIVTDAMSQMPPTISDGRASAAYRQRMIGVLTKRLLIRAGDSA